MHKSVAQPYFQFRPNLLPVYCRTPEVESENLELHIVGLNFRSSHADLTTFLKLQQQARRKRIAGIDEKLQQRDIHGLTEFLESKPCISWTRSHVAEFLVERGHSKNMQKAFKRFLRRRGAAYIAASWPSLGDTIRIIREAQGIPVLAHPTRYSLSNTKLTRLMDEFKELGGEALEVSYGGIDPIKSRMLCESAQAKQLCVSVGSDFHSAERQWTDIGKFPALDSQAIKNAIWNHPKWHLD